MTTSLFTHTVFGPIRSRRLGLSLGINLLPNNGKLCNYNCIYCECGWNRTAKLPHPLPPLCTPQEVAQSLEQALQQLQAEGQLPDAITFSGNGEPTLHPQFAQAMEAVIAQRNLHAPRARVCVLTNATNIGNPSVLAALQLADVTMLKLDAGTERTFQAINQPQTAITLQQLVAAMQHFGQRLIIQTMFLKGTINGTRIDNSQPPEVEAWLAHIEALQPKEVTLYSLDRATPAQGLEKVSPQRLNEIAQQLRAMGITATTPPMA